ncbi:MAG: hypothetical protein V7742_07305 [Halioglobus sp.]
MNSKYNSTIYFTVPIMLAVLALTVTSLPNINNPLWQDEIYTVVHFASNGFLYPFTEYHAPNNHILFSALLSQWSGPESSVAELRFFALLISCSVAIALYALGRRLGNHYFSCFLLVLYLSSPITQNFSLQLRGYSLSCGLVTLQILSALNIFHRPKKRWLAAYLVLSFLSTTTLPTNVVINASISIWAIIIITLQGQKSIQTYLVFALGPFMGLLSYSEVISSVIEIATHGASAWQNIDLLYHFYSSVYFGSIWFFLLFSITSLVLLLRRGIKHWSEQDNSILLLVAITTLVIFCWIVLPASNPYPRNLIPTLPLYCLGISLLIWKCFSFFLNTERSFFLISSLISACTIFYNLNINPCQNDRSGTTHVQNLCEQAYNSNHYKPYATVAHLLKIQANGPKIVIGGYDAEYDLNYILKYISSPLRVNNITRVSEIKFLPDYVVAKDISEAREIAKKIFPTPPVSLNKDTGYFKVYRLGDPP